MKKSILIAGLLVVILLLGCPANPDKLVITKMFVSDANELLLMPTNYNNGSKSLIESNTLYKTTDYSTEPVPVAIEGNTYLSAFSVGTIERINEDFVYVGIEENTGAKGLDKQLDFYIVNTKTDDVYNFEGFSSSEEIKLLSHRYLDENGIGENIIKQFNGKNWFLYYDNLASPMGVYVCSFDLIEGIPTNAEKKFVIALDYPPTGYSFFFIDTENNIYYNQYKRENSTGNIYDEYVVAYKDTFISSYLAVSANFSENYVFQKFKIYKYSAITNGGYGYRIYPEAEPYKEFDFENYLPEITSTTMIDMNTIEFTGINSQGFEVRYRVVKVNPEDEAQFTLITDETPDLGKKPIKIIQVN